MVKSEKWKICFYVLGINVVRLCLQDGDRRVCWSRGLHIRIFVSKPGTEGHALMGFRLGFMEHKQGVELFEFLDIRVHAKQVALDLWRRWKISYFKSFMICMKQIVLPTLVCNWLNTDFSHVGEARTLKGLPSNFSCHFLSGSSKGAYSSSIAQAQVAFPYILSS